MIKYDQKKTILLIYVILLSSINYKHYQLAARCHVPDAWKSYLRLYYYLLNLFLFFHDRTPRMVKNTSKV